MSTLTNVDVTQHPQNLAQMRRMTYIKKITSTMIKDEHYVNFMINADKIVDSMLNTKNF